MVMLDNTHRHLRIRNRCGGRPQLSPPQAASRLLDPAAYSCSLGGLKPPDDSTCLTRSLLRIFFEMLDGGEYRTRDAIEQRSGFRAAAWHSRRDSPEHQV